MIGPVIVNVYRMDGDESDGLFYMHSTENSHGVAALSYVDKLDEDSQDRDRILKTSCYESYEVLMAYIDKHNKDARHEIESIIPGIDARYEPYTVELYVGNTITIIDELTKI